MNFSWAIVDHLKEHHSGPGHAVTIAGLRRELLGLFNGARDIQIAIFALILADAPIRVRDDMTIYWDPS
jgi:hypothetical protein